MYIGDERFEPLLVEVHRSIEAISVPYLNENHHIPGREHYEIVVTIRYGNEKSFLDQLENMMVSKYAIRAPNWEASGCFLKSRQVEYNVEINETTAKLEFSCDKFGSTEIEEAAMEPVEPTEPTLEDIESGIMGTRILDL